MDEMFQKLSYDLVLSSSMVPPIFKKIHRARDTKIFDYKNIKKCIYSTKCKKFQVSKNDSYLGIPGVSMFDRDMEKNDPTMENK